MIKLKHSFLQTASLAFIVSSALLVPKLGAQVLQDDSLRANYMISFIDFLRWDRELNEPVTIGVIGSKPLLLELQKVAEVKRSKGRDFRIIEVGVENSLEGVDILYLGSGYAGKWANIIDRSKRLSVVTVGEEVGFLEAGGLIEFTIQRNRLRFSLNLDAAKEYQVGVSSKLVQLAIR